jgi:hypothetical protein
MSFQITDEGSNQTCFTAWTKINGGVPKGSVLGPLVFLIYVNELSETIDDNNIPILFADAQV